MAKFIVELYELHTQKVEVEADSKAMAVVAALSGEGDMMDNELEYIEGADEYGMSRDEDPELADEVEQLASMSCEHYIPGVRSIELSDDNDEDEDDMDEDG